MQQAGLGEKDEDAAEEKPDTDVSAEAGND